MILNGILQIEEYLCINSGEWLIKFIIITI